MHIGWPQGIMIGVLALGLLIGAILDGEDKTGKHSLAVTMLATGIQFGLLYWGGFFK